VNTRHETIAAKDLAAGDRLFVGGKHPAFQWETIRSVDACEVPVRLEGGTETQVPGRTVRYGPMGLGMAMFIDEEGVTVERLSVKRAPRP
jgi:hypothetical protein